MAEDQKTIFLCDKTTVFLAADKEGKIKVSASQLADPAVVLKGQILEIANVNGQVRATIKPAPKRISSEQLIDEIAQSESAGEVADRLTRMFHGGWELS